MVSPMPFNLVLLRVLSSHLGKHLILKLVGIQFLMFKEHKIDITVTMAFLFFLYRENRSRNITTYTLLWLYVISISQGSSS